MSDVLSSHSRTGKRRPTPTVVRGIIFGVILFYGEVPSTSSVTGGECTEPCEEWCNNECPEPPNPEVTECEILGPADPCTYGGDGCPDGEYYNGCCILWGTPILIDPRGPDPEMTSLAGGVVFPLTASSFSLQTSWLDPRAEAAWLVLDRNGNGRIDNGSELFGNYTEQPPVGPGEVRHGFRALAELDKAAGGGNSNGWIDGGDLVFGQLRLWADANHDGRSQPGELRTLGTMDISAIELDYRLSRRVDRNGNRFRYISKVHSRSSGRTQWAIDVFLMVARMHKVQ